VLSIGKLEEVGNVVGVTDGGTDEAEDPYTVVIPEQY